MRSTNKYQKGDDIEKGKKMLKEECVEINNDRECI